MNDQNNICPDAPYLDFKAIYYLERPFILTEGNLLITGMPYLYREGSYITGVRIENISIAEEMLYLQLQELGSGRMFTASWNLQYEGDYYLWTLSELERLEESLILQ